MRYVVHSLEEEYATDDKPLRTLWMKGDTRAALVPFLAHKYVLSAIRFSISHYKVEDMFMINSLQ